MAGARETLSPFIRSSPTRRLSELCRLLAPLRLSPASHEPKPRALTLASLSQLPRESRTLSSGSLSPFSHEPRALTSASLSPLTKSPISTFFQSNQSVKKFVNEEEEYKYILSKHESQIKPEEILGPGSFGTVLDGFHIYKGKAVTAKILPIRTKTQVESFQNEKNALKLLFHPNVVEVLQVLEISPLKGIVILEKLEKGNLLSKLNTSEAPFPTEFYYRCAVEISSALYHCHSNGILHLDIKPQNILFGHYGECKLTDFGSSKRVVFMYVTNGPKRVGDLSLTANYSKLDAGTVAYKAPELLQNYRPSDKCDVYSYGITLWQIITHQMPYSGENEHSIIFEVVAKGLRPNNAKLPDEEHKESSLETKFKELYEHCWDQNPQFRPTMEHVTQYLNDMKI